MKPWSNYQPFVKVIEHLDTLAKIYRILPTFDTDQCTSFNTRYTVIDFIMPQFFKIISIGIALLAHQVIANDDIFQQMCNDGIASPDTGRYYCRNCLDWLVGADNIEGCAIFWTDTKTLCVDDLFDELEDQNDVLREMAYRDTTNPMEFSHTIRRWRAEFTLGTTAITSSAASFGAWRSGIAQIVLEEGWETEMPRYWEFAVQPRGDNGFRSDDSILVSFTCQPQDLFDRVRHDAKRPARRTLPVDTSEHGEK